MASKSETAPPWLLVMRAITGLSEWEDGSNPRIEAMAVYIGNKFPDQAAYASQFDDDDIAWCGVATDFCLAASTPEGISGPFGVKDTDRWMWAESFASDPNFVHLARPVLGCITIMTREGGNHVTLYESTNSDGTINCRGGNQSNSVKISTYDPDTVIAFVWPRAWPLPEVPEIPVEDRPMLERGDDGPDVIDLQRMIPHFTGEVDGDFGPVTEENVIRYQTTRGLEVDGIVGQETWSALYENKPPLPPPEPPAGLPDPLSRMDEEAIRELALDSSIAGYSWRDRGHAPNGYTAGVALAFANVYRKFLVNHAPALEMAQARTGSEKDIFNEYASEFKSAGMSTTGGVESLVSLWALLLGLGMRESSGQHCCGRDQSVPPGYYGPADTTTEAGAWQTSYDAHGCDDTLDQTFEEYSAGAIADNPQGFRSTFEDGVSCSSADWECFGPTDSPGYRHQKMSKERPAYAAEFAAITLRNLCNHFGPVNRHEIELRRDAADLFRAVQDYIDRNVPVTS
jgi:uncharacterized protein (TIGR02594 family)